MDRKTEPGSIDDWHMTDDLHAEQGKGDPFAAAIRATRMPMLITDPRQPDNPIVFANDAFLKLSGYRRDEVIGHNCRFLQGPDTREEDIAAIRDAVAARQDIAVDILNYRKDGTPFWNALFISPVSNQSGELLFYFASQLDVTDRKQSEQQISADKDMFERAVKERTAELEAALETQKALLHEVDHRVKNNLQMVSSLILMQIRTIPDEAIQGSLRAMLSRIEALSTVHRRLYQSDDVATFDVADFARDLVTDLVAASSRNLSPRLDLEPTIVSAEKAAPLALIVNELVTNAIKHAFVGRDAEEPGTLSVRLAKPDGVLRIEVADDGVGLNGSTGADTFGVRLIRSLTKQLKADVEWRDGAPGTTAVVTVPVGHLEGKRS